MEKNPVLGEAQESQKESKKASAAEKVLETVKKAVQDAGVEDPNSEVMVKLKSAAAAAEMFAAQEIIAKFGVEYDQI